MAAHYRSRGGYRAACLDSDESYDTVVSFFESLALLRRKILCRELILNVFQRVCKPPVGHCYSPEARLYTSSHTTFTKPSRLPSSFSNHTTRSRCLLYFMPTITIATIKTQSTTKLCLMCARATGCRGPPCTRLSNCGRRKRFFASKTGDCGELEEGKGLQRRPPGIVD